MALRLCVQLLCPYNEFCTLGKTLGLQLNRRTFFKHPVLHSSSSSQAKVLLHFVNQNGLKSSVTAAEGESLLDVVIKKNLQIEGFGACEGTLACSTCHLIFQDSIYKRMQTIADEEMDMLDLAYGLTKTSRLGCQVIVEPWMHGMTVQVPQKVKDQREVKGQQEQETKDKQ